MQKRQVEFQISIEAELTYFFVFFKSISISYWKKKIYIYVCIYMQFNYVTKFKIY